MDMGKKRSYADSSHITKISKVNNLHNVFKATTVTNEVTKGFIGLELHLEPSI